MELVFGALVGIRWELARSHVEQAPKHTLSHMLAFLRRQVGQRVSKRVVGIVANARMISHGLAVAVRLERRWQPTLVLEGLSRGSRGVIALHFGEPLGKGFIAAVHEVLRHLALIEPGKKTRCRRFPIVRHVKGRIELGAEINGGHAVIAFEAAAGGGSLQGERVRTPFT